MGQVKGFGIVTSYFDVISQERAMKSILIGVCVYIGIVAVYLNFAKSDPQWLQKARFLGDRDSSSVVVYLHGMEPLDMICQSKS